VSSSFVAWAWRERRAWPTRTARRSVGEGGFVGLGVSSRWCDGSGDGSDRPSS
jgi:hypothetical protein